jgi:hypothetical protein
MQLKKSEKRMLLALVPAVIVAILIYVFPTKKPPKVPKVVNLTAGKITNQVAKIVKSGSETRSAKVAAVRFEGWGTRDPFSKPVFPSDAAGERARTPIRLKGLTWIQGKPYVLIDDLVLTVGEEKRGIRIERVEGKKVTCRKGGTVYTLQWSESP